MTQLTLWQEWGYEIDTATVMAVCPNCTKRMPIGHYSPRNYYKYCPYCGTALEEGNYQKWYRRIHDTGRTHT